MIAELLFNTNIRDINLLSIVLRVALSLVIGGILGIERGRKQRPAGFRTYMLVCLGASIVMMTNQYVFQVFDISDPVRMGAQVISGIGFLGAGTIINTGRYHVRGITTAAGLWTAACLGLAIGIGFYEMAIVGGIVVLLIMTVMQRLDERIRQDVTAELYVELERGQAFRSFVQFSRKHDIHLSDVQVQKVKVDGEQELNVILNAHCASRTSCGNLVDILREAPGVNYIEEL
ncbi:MAG TPA: MgtC/SapB family protein [Fastidiosipila sp.]|jgi:putative Mg2+ transporter-C (MgtC) family protein|nr:MgtC/SapB family protein [Fastidiosipila sp.]